ncbi:MAG: hypothetical protein LC745_07775 [Planctomycetia bacterium]|nr:hypothetical protein [Planctomycetia bacterium]
MAALSPAKHAETLRSIQEEAEAKGITKGKQWAEVWSRCNVPKGAKAADLTPAQASAVLAHVQSLPDPEDDGGEF